MQFDGPTGLQSTDQSVVEHFVDRLEAVVMHRVFHGQVASEN
jgi:hypothetical protein